MLTHSLLPTPTFQCRKESSSAFPRVRRLPAPHPSFPKIPCQKNYSFQPLQVARKALGTGRQSTQKEGRVQTSCGWSLQPSPALAMAFLQADINARRCEGVCALVWFNKVPAKHTESEDCPSPPSSLRHAEFCRAGHSLPVSINPEGDSTEQNRHPQA